MANEIDLKPVNHITVDALGPPGKRVFYILGQQEEQTIVLIAEKFQIQSMAVGIEQFMAEVQEKFPGTDDPSADYTEDQMQITDPDEPLFRVAELALGYDGDNDLMILVAKELVPELMDPDDDLSEQRVVRFWATRTKMRALAHWALEVVSRGRPKCPQCGEPMESPQDHFCPKKNGHRG